MTMATRPPLPAILPTPSLNQKAIQKLGFVDFRGEFEAIICNYGRDYARNQIIRPR